MGAPVSSRHRRRALYTLKRERLIELSDHYGLDVGDRRIVDNHVDALVRAHRVDFAELLGLLSRDELKAMCAELGLDTAGKEKQVLEDRILALGAERRWGTAQTRQGRDARVSTAHLVLSPARA